MRYSLFYRIRANTLEPTEFPEISRHGYRLSDEAIWMLIGDFREILERFSLADLLVRPCHQESEIGDFVSVFSSLTTSLLSTIPLNQSFAPRFFATA